MHKVSNRDTSRTGNSGERSKIGWLLAAGCGVVLIIAIFVPRRGHDQTGSSPAPANSNESAAATAQSIDREAVLARLPRGGAGPALNAQEVVTQKLAKFAQNRRKLALDMAAHFGKAVPPEFEQFFEAAAAGRYDEMQAIFKSLEARKKNGDESLFGPHWRALIDTLGAAEAAHDWPAQKLLAYGNSVLDSLRPGMVYAGGTDPGCFIPTMLNDTGDGERHIVLTQNALADQSYLDYLTFLYKDQMKTLTKEDSQRAFQDYISDAQKRYEHDQQFPNEPKQVRPGEDIRIIDGKVNVSGQIAVMSINEKLFQTLMRNNPDLPFGMEESYPLKAVYGNAAPLGPIMDLGSQNEGAGMTADRAAQSVDYWRTTAQQMFGDPASAEDTDPRKAYSKMIASQAGLLLDQKYTREAEEAFRIAQEICPTSPEVVFRYVNLLVEQKRFGEAIAVGQNAAQAAPENKQFGTLLGELQKMRGK